jgi:uncharacterized membrane protein YeaQ/YmgE (transglycosylase-associated protein family)
MRPYFGWMCTFPPHMPHTALGTMSSACFFSIPSSIAPLERNDPGDRTATLGGVERAPRGHIPRMTLEAFLFFLIFSAVAGLIVGAVARVLVPGPTPMGILGTILAGIAGAFLGGLVGKLLFGPAYSPGFIMSVLGAIVVVALVSRRRRVYY